MNKQDEEEKAWAEYELSKQYAKRRKTSTGLLKQLKALEKWEKVADEKFEKQEKTKEK